MRYTTISGQYQFISATTYTRVIVAAARQVLAVIYKKEINYAKAGVMLFGLCQHDKIQLDLFAKQFDKEQNIHNNEEQSRNEPQKLAVMTIMEKINKSSIKTIINKQRYLSRAKVSKIARIGK